MQKKEEVVHLSLVGNHFFFFIGEFFDEMAIFQAMQERCFDNIAVRFAVSHGKNPQGFINLWGQV